MPDIANAAKTTRQPAVRLDTNGVFTVDTHNGNSREGLAHALVPESPKD